jgi:hypothetical protein
MRSGLKHPGEHLREKNVMRFGHRGMAELRYQ